MDTGGREAVSLLSFDREAKRSSTWYILNAVLALFYRPDKGHATLSVPNGILRGVGVTLNLNEHRRRK